MPDSSPHPARPTVLAATDDSIDATGLNSMRVDVDALDDLGALAASLETRVSASPASHPTRPIRRTNSTVRATLIPLLLTAGALCEALAVAWFSTEADSPYRRVSVALPIVLIVSGSLLLFSGLINILLSRRV